MNKQEKIAAYLAEPIVKGDRVFVKTPSIKNPNREELCDVIDVLDDTIYYKDEHSGQNVSILKSDVRKDVSRVGADPFQEPVRAQQFNVEIWQLLFRMGWDVKRNGEAVYRYQNMGGYDVPEVNYNSTVEGTDGQDIVYQRSLVWTEVEKKLLIDSIYNNIEIGKFVIRNRSWPWVEKRLRQGKVENTAFADVVDGKQRLNAILEFVSNKFADSYGNYWHDLSEHAQRKFQGFMKFAYLELDEHTDDETTLKTFLAINFTGAPMSQEHIDYVRSIKI